MRCTTPEYLAQKYVLKHIYLDIGAVNIFISILVWCSPSKQTWTLWSSSLVSPMAPWSRRKRGREELDGAGG